jgi:hypothetical protein
MSKSEVKKDGRQVLRKLGITTALIFKAEFSSCEPRVLGPCFRAVF